MTRRIRVLAFYFWRRLTFSLSGVVYAILAFVYWALLFPPGQGTPDVEYYILVIGAYGATLTFFAALSIAARANKAANYPLVVRLPSRVEYLTAVLLSTFLYACMLQLLVGLLALVRGPQIPLGRLLEIPPIWLAANTLAAVLAMHASDLVTAAWSRVYIFGILAILLFGQSGGEAIGQWLSARLSSLSMALLNQGWSGPSSAIIDLADWLGGQGPGVLDRVFGFLFWPFRAIVEAITHHGFFDTTQALAPAVILLYATILFMLAADFFASKDLDFTE